MFVVAIEGCSHAGKSTLVDNLTQRLGDDVIALPDYVSFAGGDTKVPRAPAESVEEEVEALRFFLTLDYRRWSEIIKHPNEKRIILVDRSFHTLLAHRFAIERLTHLEVFDLSCKEVKSRPDLLMPDVIFYIDTPQEVLNERYKTRISNVPVSGHIQNYNYTQKMKLVFNKENYNQYFRSYFIPRLLFAGTPVKVLDGRLSINETIENALVQTVKLRP
jgi:thymidylate kinase